MASWRHTPIHRETRFPSFGAVTDFETGFPCFRGFSIRGTMVTPQVFVGNAPVHRHDAANLASSGMQMSPACLRMTNGHPSQSQDRPRLDAAANPENRAHARQEPEALPGRSPQRLHWRAVLGGRNPKDQHPLPRPAVASAPRRVPRATLGRRNGLMYAVPRESTEHVQTDNRGSPGTWEILSSPRQIPGWG